MTAVHSVLIADDHELVRSSIEKLLLGEDDFEVVGQVSSAADAVGAAERLLPDLALLDISMPGDMDGLGAVPEIRRVAPDSKIVLLTMHDDDVSLTRATECGVDGYLSKTATMDEIVRALRTVLSGSPYVSPELAMRMMQLARQSPSPTTLTDREVEVLTQLANGLRIQEIADALFLSSKTVKNHLTSIYAKLGVETASQAVAIAYQSGLVVIGG